MGWGKPRRLWNPREDANLAREVREGFLEEGRGAYELRPEGFINVNLAKQTERTFR